MPSVRFSRDKRGYEYIYLVHTPTRRGKPGRTRVLYWYRTPPGVRIGRKPFDEEVQRTLEAQNPGLTFDWEAIIATPMPPPDLTEYWRERRRAEKAARQERRAQEAEEAVRGTEEADREPGEESASGDEGVAVSALPGAEVVGDLGIEDTVELAADVAGAEVQAAPAGARRRRRRGRRRRPGGGAVESAAGSVPAAVEETVMGQEPSEPPDPASE